MRTWFGGRADDRWELAGRTPEQLASFAGASDSRGISKDMDLAAIAIDAGLCDSRASYRELMHETAMALARDRIAGLLSAEDADVVQSIKALDTALEAFNEMSERIVEWYGIHHPEAKLRPQEIIAALTRAGAEAEADFDSRRSRTPMPMVDFEALQGYAQCARSLYEERKRLELYIAGCMEDVAPNLSGVLGPMLGARLIARAGGLGRLARLPAGTIQVMGAREALFKHIREGTPSPKHGFIYRHPLVSGSPKRLRGRISRMLAGKAAIAARVDFYSGERAGLDEEVEKRAAVIRGGRRGGKDGP